MHIQECGPSRPNIQSMNTDACWGAYHLEERLGSGAMGDVWRAIDTRLARPVALKRLSAARLQEADARARFLRESRAASALNHPNIVTVFEAGEHEGEPFLAMELIEGQTLRELLMAGLQPREKAIEAARQLLRGLAVAHEAGIIHRDVKPENVMVRRDGYVKILDFGLAEMAAADTLTKTGDVVGTPLYMSPEQASGLPVDARTDVYSAGVVIYELLAGRPPYNGVSLYEIFAQIMEQKPQPLAGASADLNAFLARALEKDPAARFADAGAMFDSLQRVTHARQDRKPRDVEVASLAVLPLSSSADDEELAEGVVEELIANLDRVHGLRVIARSTSMRYRGRNVEAREVGRELNVEMVLEGSLRRSGNRVRASASLIEVRSGFTLWSGRFESILRDVFDLQDELASAIVGALRERFTTLESLHLGGTVAVKTEVNEMYLLGVRKLDTLAPENVLVAVEALQRAIELQPDFAAAHARLAQALVHKLNFFPPDDPRPLLEQARAAATEALKIDPSNADAHFGLAFIQLSRTILDWRAARRHMRQALRLSPNHVPALTWLAFIQTLLGNAEDGERYARRAIARDPQGVNQYMWLSYSLLSRGRLDEAADPAERALRLDPRNGLTHAILLMLDLFRGRDQDAARFAGLLDTSGGHNPILRATQLVYRARTRGLRWRDITEADRMVAGAHVLGLRVIADIPALDGDVDAAMRLLHAARELGERNLPWLDHDPFLEPLRGSPAFLEFRAEMAREIEQDSEQ